jgi:hypothetical protein
MKNRTLMETLKNALSMPNSSEETAAKLDRLAHHIRTEQALRATLQESAVQSFPLLKDYIEACCRGKEYDKLLDFLLSLEWEGLGET